MSAFVRYVSESGPAAGIVGDDGTLHHLGPSLGALWRSEVPEIRAQAEQALALPGRPAASARLLAPIDSRTPLWAAGVTYLASRDARMEESRSHDVYERVYHADRPELFFKAQSHEVVTSGDPVGRRPDSANDTPEPELAVVVNSAGEVVAFGAANDMSSRSIEGENPLYLPQAKIYPAAAVLAPTLRPAWEVPDPRALEINLAIRRAGRTVFQGSTSTRRMKRGIGELVSWLTRGNIFVEGAILSTGTCVVPPLGEPARDGDVIEIDIPGVGRTRNTVTATTVLASWWRGRLDDPALEYKP